MNAFRILNSNNVAIPIKELDREAAEFWNKPVEEKYYANPYPDIVPAEDATWQEKIEVKHKNASHNGGNWYDIIGWNIAHQGNYTSGWQNVVHTLMATSLGEALLNIEKGEPISTATFHQCEDGQLHLEDIYEHKLYATIEFYKPYIALINHWADKGYTPELVVE